MSYSKTKKNEKFCDEPSKTQTLSDDQLGQINGGTACSSSIVYWMCRDCRAKQMYDASITACNACGSTNIVRVEI